MCVTRAAVSGGKRPQGVIVRVTIRINKQDLLMQIRANPADPQLFELFYCADCGEFAAGGGLFAPASSLRKHRAHALAVLPGQDSPLSGETGPGLIPGWLESYRCNLTIERYHELLSQSSRTNSGNWVWLLRGAEQAGWLAYLNLYLDRLSESWLAALNGVASTYYPVPENIWRNRPYVGGEQFQWAEAFLPQAESELLRINSLSV